MNNQHSLHFCPIHGKWTFFLWIKGKRHHFGFYKNKKTATIFFKDCLSTLNDLNKASA